MDHPADAVLRRLYASDAAQRAAGLPSSQRTRNVEYETGLFLKLVARSLNAKSVVEIGSSNGVSTVWLARGLPADGTITGTEILPERAAEANANLAEAGLANVARIVAGDARAALVNLPGPFDFAFIDAEKDDYVDHFLAIIDRVHVDGVILADNVVSHDLSAYQSMLRQRDDVETVTLPLDRGLEYTVKLR
ncbi:MAG: DUF1442 domain-containing protein [Chloroflexia bacterium]|nr:DUF1442 domain-containing protein [Chloroflexia bacterium]